MMRWAARQPKPGRVTSVVRDLCFRDEIPFQEKGGLLTWDRLILDAISNGFPEAELLGKLTVEGAPASEADSEQAARNAWRIRLDAAPPIRPKHRHEKAA